MRTPIQRMIDAACGFPDGLPPQPVVNGRDADDAWLILSCPRCLRFAAAEREPESFDPPTATLIEVQCPDCISGDFDGPAYFDAAGRSLVEDVDPPKCRGDR